VVALALAAVEVMVAAPEVASAAVSDSSSDMHGERMQVFYAHPLTVRCGVKHACQHVSAIRDLYRSAIRS
jgi:hypothetical protein